MLLVKAGVDISRLKPPIRKCFPCVYKVYEAIGEHMIITSTDEGAQEVDSLHYADLAIHLAYPLKMSAEFMSDVIDCFSDEYAVVAEHDHIDIEFCPIWK